MKSHLYILGRTPDLAFWELKTFLPDVIRLQDHVAQSVNALPIAQLGGTVKIAEKIGEANLLDPGTVASFIDTTHRTVFGVSVYGAAGVGRKFLEEVKSLLYGASSRYIEAKEHELSSVVIKKHDVQEIIFVKVGDSFVVAKTVAVQPFEEWGERDFGRPYADPKAGMLPPKVSRMAVNIAGIGREKTLLDPFCGMGTILSEALLMGWNVVGSDQSAEVIEKTRANMRWLLGKNKLGVTYRLLVSDAVHISEHLDSSTIDAIVTEPFMGSTKIKDVRNTIKGLEKLYIGCLKEWRLLLKPHGVIMMALPAYELNEKTYFVKKVIDMCEKLGYTIEAGPIEYGRPGAIVKRNFYLFQKI